MKSRTQNLSRIGGGVFFACVEGSNDAIMLTDAAGFIFYVNPAWEKLFGYSLAEVHGHTPRLLRSGHHPPDFYSRMWEDILNPAIACWRGEVLNKTKAGREVPVLLTISPFVDDSTGTRGYMSNCTDLSAQKKMEMQLYWQDRLSTVGLLTAGLAHEMGTPLGVARGRAEYLLSKLQEKKEKSGLVTIIEQIDRISCLMAALQNISQIDYCEVRHSVDVRRIVEDVQKLIEGKLGKSGIQFSVELPDQVFVLGESGRLAQVLLSLCLNSLQAIEARISRPSGPVPFIRVSARDVGEAWEIAVTDNGGGVAKEHVSQLFKPFFTTREIGTATGLGLASAHQAVRSWGGDLDFENQPGEGATFKIVLEKSPPFAPTAPTTP